MTKDEITCMAREADASFETAESMFKFAALVAAAEREACAKVAEDMNRAVLAMLNVTSQPKALAAAIRERVNT